MIDDVKEFLSAKEGDGHLRTAEQQEIAKAVIQQMGGAERFLSTFQNLGGDSTHTGKWIDSKKHVNIKQCAGFVVTDDIIGLYEDNHSSMLDFLSELSKERGEISIVEMIFGEITKADITNVTRDNVARGLHQPSNPKAYTSTSIWISKVTASMLAAEWTLERFFAFMNTKYPSKTTKTEQYLTARLNDGPYSFPLSKKLTRDIIRQLNKNTGLPASSYKGLSRSCEDIVNSVEPLTPNDLGFTDLNEAKVFFHKHASDLLFFIKRMGERQGLKSVIATLNNEFGSKTMFDCKLSEDEIAKVIYGDEEQPLSKKEEDLLFEILLKATVFLCKDYQIYREGRAVGQQLVVATPAFTGEVAIKSINTENSFHESNIFNVFKALRIISTLTPLKGLQVSLDDSFEEVGLRKGVYLLTDLIGVLGRDKKTFLPDTLEESNTSNIYKPLSQQCEKSLLIYITGLLIDFEIHLDGMSIHLKGNDEGAFTSGGYSLPEMVSALTFVLQRHYNQMY